MEAFEPWQGTVPEFVQRIAATLSRSADGYLATMLSIWLGFRVFWVTLEDNFFDVEVANIDADKVIAALGGELLDVPTYPQLVRVRVPLDRARFRVTVERR
jgi:hypothetical protein